MDIPGERHSHTAITPRGGGAGLILAVLVVSLAYYLPGKYGQFWPACVLPGVILLSLTGWWDDHTSLSARFRFVVQLIVSTYLIGCMSEQGWIEGVQGIAVALLALVWMTNLYNFMDGSNGMAGFQGVFSGLILAWLFSAGGDELSARISLVVAAACAGFLPWNLGRARVFMGDVASGSLGFIFAAVLIYGATTGVFSFTTALLVMLVFLTDSTLTLLLRVMQGEQWYTAHKQHLYQRLIEHGWSHGSVLMLYQAINLVLVMPGIAVAVSFPDSAWLVAVAMIAVFGLGWCLVIRRLGVLA
jgi:UDP-N-acetylmuramyl pentapeptide phosphotransferase/UDP-N-acetylglucosamine-1-phosphate transferase